MAECGGVCALAMWDILPDPIKIKNDRNSGIWQSGITKSLEEYVKRYVCFVNVQSSLHENVVFSVCAFMGNAVYIIFIIWNTIRCRDLVSFPV